MHGINPIMNGISWATIVNPRRMCEGYSSHSVCVYLSVTTKSATNLVYTSKTRCHRVLYGVSRFLSYGFR